MEPVTEQQAAPVKRLYRHALESVFKFCALEDLHAILAVCRDWSSAVGSMPPTGLQARAASIDHLLLIAHSRLARQVTRIWGDCAHTLAGLRILADCMPWIAYVGFQLPEQGDIDCAEQALFLSRLSRMKSFDVYLHRRAVPLTMESMDQHAAAANQLIKAAGCIRQLEQLNLYLMCHDERICLAPLTALTRLRTFRLWALSNLISAIPSDEQLAAVRTMHSVEQFVHNFSDRSGTLRLLLQAPTPPLRWTSTDVASGAHDLLPLLRSLPNLGKLEVSCVCGDVEFLLSLTRVTTLMLYPLGAGLRARFIVAPADVTRIVATLQRCPHLTSLSLHQLGVTPAHLSSLLPCLPRLSRLALVGPLPELTSLSFLATEALAGSLTAFSTWGCERVPSDEIIHLLGLRSLRELSLGAFREPLSAAQKAQLQSAHPGAQL